MHATVNYVGTNAKFTNPGSWYASGAGNDVGLWMAAADYSVGGGTCDVFFSRTTPSSTSFDCSGVANPAAVARAAGPRVEVTSPLPTPVWVAGVASFSADVLLHRADLPDGAYAGLKVGIAPRDPDGVTLLPDALDLDTDDDGTDDRAVIATTDVRHGRLLIPNIYGSHLLPLPVPVQAQYWNGATASYVFNGADSCTPLAATGFAVTAGTGAAINTVLSGGGKLAGGAGTLTLSKPAPPVTGNGSVVLATGTSSPTGLSLNDYLPGKGMETFGVYKAGPVIYLRERY